MRVFLLSFFLLAAFGDTVLLAGEADIDDDLAAARKAWEEGDKLGVAALRDYQLLDKREQAYERAEQAFRSALKKDAKHPHALADFGRFFKAQKEYCQARLWLEAAERSPRAAMFLPAERAEL